MDDVNAARAKGAADRALHHGAGETDQSVPQAGLGGEIRKSLGMEKAGDVAVFGEIRARKDKF